MPANRSKLEREKDRAFVAEKYLMQWTQQEIADALNTTQQTISNDLKAIQKAWRESSIMDMNEAKQRELERVDKLEREYWQAWEESKKDAETITKKAKGDEQVGKEVTLQRKGQVGDPRFLTGVMTCIERRCKLLGVDSPQQFEEIDWRSRAIEGIKARKIAFSDLVNAINDIDLATELFKRAGVPIDND